MNYDNHSPYVSFNEDEMRLLLVALRFIYSNKKRTFKHLDASARIDLAEINVLIQRIDSALNESHARH